MPYGVPSVSYVCSYVFLWLSYVFSYVSPILSDVFVFS